MIETTEDDRRTAGEVIIELIGANTNYDDSYISKKAAELIGIAYSIGAPYDYETLKSMANSIRKHLL
jgi:hypothetical protein